MHLSILSFQGWKSNKKVGYCETEKTAIPYFDPTQAIQRGNVAITTSVKTMAQLILVNYPKGPYDGNMPSPSLRNVCLIHC